MAIQRKLVESNAADTGFQYDLALSQWVLGLLSWDLGMRTQDWQPKRTHVTSCRSWRRPTPPPSGSGIRSGVSS